MKKSLLFFILTFPFYFIHAQSGTWTWMKGDANGNLPAVYGTRGISAPANKPLGRYESSEWKDNQGNFWVFGGLGGFNSYNDLWKFNPASNDWAWMNGDTIPDQAGVYGTLGVSSPQNKPGARGYGSLTWVDNNGNFWLFGGTGYDRNGSYGDLNDLWKYDPLMNEWTWMSGSSTDFSNGNYGTKGIAAASNLPPARDETAASWMDNNGNLWMFGGHTFNMQLNQNLFLNDLWKYDLSTNLWTWMSGDDNTANHIGVYGTKFIASPNNKPGSRWCYDSWKDNSGNFWLWGGEAWDGTGGNLYNDMWKYNVSTNEWTWMSGSNAPQQPGNFLVSCPDTTAMPGANTETRAHWTDACGNFWLFGSDGNRLFYYSVTDNKWRWVNGTGYYSSYGTIGVGSPTNVPGTRSGCVAWSANNALWLFGGDGMDITNTSHHLNDMWKFSGDEGCGCVTGINKNDLPEKIISIYPNPAGNEFHITTTEEIEHFEIVNMLGEIVLAQKNIDDAINVSEFSEGIYLVQIYFTNGTMETEKLNVRRK